MINTPQTMNYTSAPNTYARAGGIAYLIIIIAGALGEMFVRNTLVVSGDAAATANNILTHPQLWRAGIAGDLLMHICDVIVMIALYVLLKPINRNLALMAMLFTLIQTSVLVANKMNLIMPMLLLENSSYLQAFTQSQLQAWSYVLIRAHGYGFGVGLLFFGFECLVNGHLLRKSVYFPKVFGVMIQIAGLCYITNSLALLVAPALAGILFPAIMLPPLIAETSLAIRLLLKGVNVEKWNERISSLQ